MGQRPTEVEYTFAICRKLFPPMACASGHYQMLYALLAGCGPLRAGEALGLEIGKHISPDFRTLYVTQKAKRGEIQPYLKTKNGAREVDLCVNLAAMLKEYAGERTEGLLFRTASGAQLLQTNCLRDSLHPILTKLEHVKGGFNIFRRYRITYLEKSDCPDSLKHFWSGHAQKHISERYVKLLRGAGIPAGMVRVDRAWIQDSYLSWTTRTTSRGA